MPFAICIGSPALQTKCKAIWHKRHRVELLSVWVDGEVDGGRWAVGGGWKSENPAPQFSTPLERN